MSIDIGIIGLARSGKTTVYNSLCGLSADRPGSISSVGITKVPDPRLNALAELLHPKKVITTEVKFTDVGAGTKGLAEGRGFSGQFLAELSNTDALLAVVRAFPGETIPHPEGSLDPVRDLANLNLELAMADLAIIERRLNKIDESLKGAKPPERQQLLKEKVTLVAYQEKLENDTPLRDLSLSPADAGLIANYQFLTAKPLLIIVNLGDGQTDQADEIEAQLASKYAGGNCRIGSICGELEMELARLDEATAASFRAEYGINQSGRDRLITLAYETLGLITFFTTASEELKAWPVTNGTTALKAAGKIHSDMERGFIRAEVTGYEDLLQCGGPAAARRQGKLRLEGKDYPVKEGDVITFLFNV